MEDTTTHASESDPAAFPEGFWSSDPEWDITPEERSEEVYGPSGREP